MKSRIEEVIKAARDSNEKVLASFEKMLNEIEESLTPESRDHKFKVGDWFVPHKPDKNVIDTQSRGKLFWNERMDEFNNKPLQIQQIIAGELLSISGTGFVFHPDWCTYIPKGHPDRCEKWEPRKGAFFTKETLIDKMRDEVLAEVAKYIEVTECVNPIEIRATLRIVNTNK